MQNLHFSQIIHKFIIKQCKHCNKLLSLPHTILLGEPKAQEKLNFVYQKVPAVSPGAVSPSPLLKRFFYLTSAVQIFSVNILFGCFWPVAVSEVGCSPFLDHLRLRMCAIISFHAGAFSCFAVISKKRNMKIFAKYGI